MSIQVPTNQNLLTFWKNAIWQSAYASKPCFNSKVFVFWNTSNSFITCIENPLDSSFVLPTSPCNYDILLIKQLYHSSTSHLTSATRSYNLRNLSRLEVSRLTPIKSLYLSVTYSVICNPLRWLYFLSGCCILSRSWIVWCKYPDNSSKSNCFWSLAFNTS